MIGRKLKHYEIESSLGQGGMGVVYLARDTRLDRPVALKLLSEELTGDPERRRRFLQEARAAGKVNHPAIAQIYDVDESDGVIFIAMEYVEGSTLRRLVQDRELDLLGVLEIGSQVAKGLAKAHDAGIVHRDIKSDNIMVTRDGHAKILDFGLAKLHEPLGGGSGGDDASAMETMAKTRAGVVMGTVAYMSPEQARAHAVDSRSDVFSLGVVLYEMVTGQMPFSKDSPLDTMYAIAFEETRPVTALRTNLPPSLQRVVSRCLRKRPDDRYQRVQELAGDLENVKREIESGVSQAVPLAERIREGIRSLKDLTPSEVAWPVAGVAVIALVLALVMLGRGDNLGVLIAVAFFGLIFYRRLRHRRRRLFRRFVAKVRKLKEVRAIARDGDRITVVVSQAAARTYIRVNALMDQINGRLYTGEPFTVSVRDDLSDEELGELLRGPGIAFVRDEVLAERR